MRWEPKGKASGLKTTTAWLAVLVAPEVRAVALMLHDSDALSRRGMDDTSARLADDSASLERSRSTTERYLAKLPVVGGLIGSIRDRRKRSQLILASVIAAVVCFFLWFLVLRNIPSSAPVKE